MQFKIYIVSSILLFKIFKNRYVIKDKRFSGLRISVIEILYIMPIRSFIKYFCLCSKLVENTFYFILIIL